MSMESSGGNGGAAAGPAPNAPQLMVLAQYVKDLSFENPHAPNALNQTSQPQVSVNVHVAVNPMAAADYEVQLRLEGKAEMLGNVMFNVELVFAGIFRLQNVPPENTQLLLMIECPRLLFPFAREIVANSVRNGGYPPLLIDPIDFVSLYHQRMSQGMQQPPAAPSW
jgi:preprotein translocase subunit SecB